MQLLLTRAKQGIIFLHHVQDCTSSPAATAWCLDKWIKLDKNDYKRMGNILTHQYITVTLMAEYICCYYCKQLARTIGSLYIA